MKWTLLQSSTTLGSDGCQLMLTSILLGSALLQCRRRGASLMSAVVSLQCHSPASHAGIVPAQHEQARQAAGGQPTCSSRDAGVCSHGASQQQQQNGHLQSMGPTFSHLPSHEVQPCAHFPMQRSPSISALHTTLMAEACCAWSRCRDMHALAACGTDHLPLPQRSKPPQPGPATAAGRRPAATEQLTRSWCCTAASAWCPSACSCG